MLVTIKEDEVEKIGMQIVLPSGKRFLGRAHPRVLAAIGGAQKA
jgi:hypothetical protein